MAATFTHYEFQSRQRLTTDGLNDQDAWTGRLSGELLRRLLLGDVTNVSGVISGLIPNVVAATMNVQVGGGLGLFYDPTVPDPDSQHRWIELGAAGKVVTLDAGGGSPRWDVIEIAPGVVDGTPDILDIYDPALGAPVATPLSPLKIGTPTVTVRKGTEGANPKFPDGIAGVIPLAYVYVAAGAVVLNVDQVWHCRPILTPRRGVYRGEDLTSITSPYTESLNISGGGWAIAANGYVGTLAASMNGSFPNGGLPFSIPGNAAVSLITGNYEGGGLPAGNTMVHAYVAPPPYPAGYDATMGPRELYIKDTTIPNVAVTVPAGTRNCIVLTSSSGPNVTSPLGQRGNPSASTGTFTDNLWGAFTRIRSNLLYIGAAYHVIAVPGLIAQRVEGATVSTSRKPGASATADLPIAAPTIYNLRENAVGDPAIQWPETAIDIDMQIRSSVDAGGELVIEVEDYFGLGGNIGTLDSVYSNTSGGQQRVGDVVPIQLTSGGSVQINYASGTGVASLRLYGKCYRDAVLKQR